MEVYNIKELNFLTLMELIDKNDRFDVKVDVDEEKSAEYWDIKASVEEGFGD